MSRTKRSVAIDMPGAFIDTNVLVYLASGDAAKADRAEQIVFDGGTISVQVLNELANVARRKMQLSWQETEQLLSVVRRMSTVVPLSVEIHEVGLALAQRYSLSIYDAMIVAAALGAQCTTLWSEDMQDGVVLGGKSFGGKLRVRNPFRGR